MGYAHLPTLSPPCSHRPTLLSDNVKACWWMEKMQVYCSSSSSNNSNNNNSNNNNDLEQADTIDDAQRGGRRAKEV